ncbi:MAG: nuclear transport factor 2 family protein [Candidatus Latescibacterota bacterium]
MTPVEVVHAMYRCFKTGDMETLRRDIFAEDLVWRLPGRSPVAGDKQGMQEVLGFFGSLRKLGLTVAPEGMTPLGEDKVAEFYHASGSANGAELKAYNCNLYTVRDGRIREVQVFMSDQYGYDAFAWTAFRLKPLPERLA